jgi:hypothetical protein
VKGYATERACQQLAQGGAVVHVHPFRRSHEHAHVALLCELTGLEEEMNVRSRQLARLDAGTGGAAGEPGFPSRSDVVMPDIGRISDEQGPATCGRQVNGAVIVHDDPGPLGETAGCEVTAQDQRGEGVIFHADQLGIRKLLARRHQETTGTCSRVYDSGRLSLGCCPSGHARHNGRGRVNGPELSPFQRGAQHAERVT